MVLTRPLRVLEMKR